MQIHRPTDLKQAFSGLRCGIAGTVMVVLDNLLDIIAACPKEFPRDMGEVLNGIAQLVDWDRLAVILVDAAYCVDYTVIVSPTNLLIGCQPDNLASAKEPFQHQRKVVTVV